jgi:hypothetical protein
VPPQAPAGEPAPPAEPFVFTMPEEPAGQATVKLPEAENAPAGEGEAVPAELPDWLKNAPTLSEQPSSVSTAEALPAEELPDWLKEQVPGPAVEQPEMVEEIPDWLQETLPQTPASQTAFLEEPDWLTGAALAGEALPAEETPLEEVPAVEVPVEAAEAHWEPLETREETHAKFIQNLASLPAMDADFANQLRAAGVTMPLHLLKKGATPDSRQKLAEQAGIDRAELDTWVNIADMLRVRGLTTKHALLLESVGIHGVSELANADPDSLTQSVVTTNQEYNLLDETPRRPEIASWINQAKELPAAVS